MKDFGLYLIITNPLLDYRKIAEICVKNEIKMLQLRQKKLNDKELLKIAREIKSITDGTETKFIFNDRIDLAIASNADGIHLGQDDLPIEIARKFTNKPMIFGLSTHSIAQAKEALTKKPDYIGFGPIYETPTKEIADPTVGTELLKEVIQFSNVPVVAIGGIDDSNIKYVIDAGAKNICLVRYFMNTTELDYRIKKIKDMLNN